MSNCDKCGHFLSVKLKYENGKCIMTPVSYTTNCGGAFCGTGCSMSYIKKQQTVKDVNPNSGMHVQREEYGTNTLS